MPSSRSKRIPRCTYQEGTRRCIRNAAAGTHPALCNAHLVLFADIGKPRAGRVPGQGMIDVLTDLLSGQRVSRSRAQEAVNELFAGGWDIGGFMASGYMPGIPHDAPRTGPFAGAFPGAGHQRATVDPELAQLLEARRRARVVLGFAESEPVTKQTLKARHRELVRKHHPDHGGSVEKMKMVNAAKDVLEAEIA